MLCKFLCEFYGSSEVYILLYLCGGSGLDTYENWYKCKGRDAAEGKPGMTDQTGAAYISINVMVARRLRCDKSEG